MSQPKIPPEVLAKAAQLSPENFGKLSLYLGQLSRAFMTTGKATTVSEARKALQEAANILAENPSQAEVVRALRTAARDFDDNDALRFCRDATAKFSKQADALQKTLDAVVAYQAQSQKKSWWKFW